MSLDALHSRYVAPTHTYLEEHQVYSNTSALLENVSTTSVSILSSVTATTVSVAQTGLYYTGVGILSAFSLLITQNNPLLLSFMNNVVDTDSASTVTPRGGRLNNAANTNDDVDNLEGGASESAASTGSHGDRAAATPMSIHSLHNTPRTPGPAAPPAHPTLARTPTTFTPRSAAPPLTPRLNNTTPRLTSSTPRLANSTPRLTSTTPRAAESQVTEVLHTIVEQVTAPPATADWKVFTSSSPVTLIAEETAVAEVPSVSASSSSSEVVVAASAPLSSVELGVAGVETEDRPAADEPAAAAHKVTQEVIGTSGDACIAEAESMPDNDALPVTEEESSQMETPTEQNEVIVAPVSEADDEVTAQDTPVIQEVSSTASSSAAVADDFVESPSHEVDVSLKDIALGEEEEEGQAETTEGGDLDGAGSNIGNGKANKKKKKKANKNNKGDK